MSNKRHHFTGLIDNTEIKTPLTNNVYIAQRIARKVVKYTLNWL